MSTSVNDKLVYMVFSTKILNSAATFFELHIQSGLDGQTYHKFWTGARRLRYIIDNYPCTCEHGKTVIKICDVKQMYNKLCDVPFMAYLCDKFEEEMYNARQLTSYQAERYADIIKK